MILSGTITSSTPRTEKGRQLVDVTLTIEVPAKRRDRKASDLDPAKSRELLGKAASIEVPTNG